jgi:hypothetical protein
MGIFIYRPHPGDFNDTEVMGVKLQGGVPVDVDERSERGERLAHLLRSSPWFSEEVEVVGDPSHRQAGDP